MAGFPTSNDLGSGLSSEVARLDFGVRDLTCFSEGGKARSVRCGVHVPAWIRIPTRAPEWSVAGLSRSEADELHATGPRVET
jgi:hypothetical protein